MLRCLTGTWRLNHNPLAWEREQHVITWCNCQTLPEAEQKVTELRVDEENRFNRNLIAVWWEEA
jgi:hypothetical protein